MNPPRQFLPVVSLASHRMLFLRSCCARFRQTAAFVAAILALEPAARATNTASTLATGTELFSSGNWSLGTLPLVSHDALLSATGATSYTFSGANTLTVGSLNYQGAFASTLGNATAATTSTLTLGGAGNLGNGLAAKFSTDLLSVASGSTLTLQNGTGAFALALGQDGTVNTLGTLAINVPISGAFGFTKTGGGTLTLASASTYTGTTTINGPLTLDFSAASAPASGGIIANAATSNATATPLVFLGGTLTLRGKSAATNTQFFNGTTLNTGGSRITLTQNSATTLTAALGAITRNAGGALNFSTVPLTTGIIATTTNTNDATGLLGPWASVGTGTSLQYATVNGSSQIVAYSGATADAGNLASATNPAVNYSYAAAATLTADATAHTLRYTGAATTTALGTSTLTLNGLLHAGSGTLTVSRTGAPGGVIIGDSRELIVSTAGQAVTFTAPIADNAAGASSVVVTGTSAVSLSAANTFSGGLTVANTAAGGRVTFTNNTAALGTGTVTLAGGGTVTGAGNQNLFSSVSAITVPNNFVIVTGTQNRFEFSQTGTWGLTGSITGGGFFALSSGFSPTMQLGGNITGFTGVLQLQGNGAGNAATTNYDFTNTTTIGAAASRVQLAPGANGTNATNLVLLRWNPSTTTSATIPLGELSSLISSPQTSANAVLTNAKASTTATWQIGALNTHTTFAGAITANSGTPTALSALEKVGTGMLTLTDANTYTGATTVSAGMLLVNGTHASATTVNAGSFGGTGSSSAAVAIGNNTGTADAFLRAGGSNGIGTFTTTAATTFGSDGVFAVEFNSTAGTADKLTSAGLTLDAAATLTVSEIVSDTLAPGTVFTIIDNTAGTPISGIFAGLTEGASISVSGKTFSISYTGGTGNDVTLTLLATPVLTSATSTTGVVGSPFVYTITTAAGSPITSYNATSLPAGLSVNTSTGVITGTPSSAGVSNVTISATNVAGTSSTTLALTIETANAGAPALTSSTTATGSLAAGFSYAITGTNTPTSYAASGLPPGLSIDTNTGAITGTPTSTGTWQVMLTALNASGRGTTVLTLTITPAIPVITSAATATGSVDVPFSYQIAATHSPTSFAATSLPPGLTVNTTTGTLLGIPSTTGTFNVTVSATNQGITGSATLTLTIAAATYSGNTANTLATGTELATAASWSLATLPIVSHDAVLSATSATAYTLSGANTLTAGSLNYQGAFASTLGNATAATTSTLTLGGSGNEGNALAAKSSTDLLTVAAGGTLTLQHGSGTLAVVLGQEGTVNTPGTLAINVPVTGAFGLNKTGGGTLTLASASTYTGATSINGPLTADFSATTAPASGGIIANTATSNATATPLVLRGGTLTLKGKSAATNTQFFNGTTLATGGSRITLTQNSATTLTAALGGIARVSGGALNFSTVPLTTGVIATTTTINDPTGLLGPWASVGTGTSLQYATVNGSGQIVAYSGATSDTGNLASLTNPAVNYSYAAAATPTANATANTLRYTGVASTTALGATNTLTLNGLLNAGSGTLTISGTATAGSVFVGSSRELVVNAAGQSISITAKIVDSLAGASSVLITGSSEVQLNGANTYSGGLVIANTATGGRARANSGANNGFGTGTITLAGSGNVTGSGTSNLYASGTALSLPNNFVIVSGTQNKYEFSQNGTWGINGSITGGGLFALASGFAPTMQLRGDVTGFTGVLQLQGNGSGNGTQTTNYDFTNTTTIGAAKARIQIAPGANPGTNGTTAGNTAALRWNPSTTTSATIPLGELSSLLLPTQTGANAILTNAKAATTATWQIGALNTDTSFDGVIAANSGTPTALTALEKVGSGTLTLGGANTYTGATTVSAGTLLVNGTLASAATVNAGSFGGTGTSAAAVTIGNSAGTADAFLHAGRAGGIGNLTTTAATTFRSDGVFAVEFNSTAGTADKITTAGLTLNAATTLTLTELVSGTLASGTVFTIVDNTAAGSIAGTFAGLSEGATITASGKTFLISYTGGTGNDITLTLLGVPVITSATTTTGVASSPFAYTIDTNSQNSVTSYNATGLPAGLSINTSTGVITGTPAAAGVSNVTLNATNAVGTGSASLTLTIESANAGAPVITSATNASGSVASAFNYAVTATNSPTSYDASGLPAGLNIDTSTGAITGTPTTAGTHQVMLSATNVSGLGTTVLTLTITPALPVISSPVTASGMAGVAFTYQITATHNPLSFDATGLPSGLAVNTATGLISGTPTAAGTSTVTLKVIQSYGEGTATLTLTILPSPPVITSVTYFNRLVNAPLNYTIAATNSPTSFTAVNLPAGLALDTSTGAITGTPTAAGKSTVTLTVTNAGGTGTTTLTLVISTRFNTHPGIPLTVSDLDTLKANLNVEPWKSGYAALVADSHSKLTYVMRGPFPTVNRTGIIGGGDDIGAVEYNNDMQAVYNLARMWYFTGDGAYAQKARDILMAWAAVHTGWGGAEPYLTLCDQAQRTFGGADILRGTWPGWTQADTDTLKNYFNNVYWNQIAVPNPVRSANQGALQILAATAIAVFNDDEEKMAQALRAFRTDAVGGLPESLPNGQIGDSGRDQGHAYGQVVALAFVAEVFWKQGIDVFSDLDNRLLAVGEFYSRYNSGAATPYVPFGSKYDYYWQGHGGAPNSSLQPPDAQNLIYSAYVTRKGLTAPWIALYRATRAETADSFVFRKPADTSTATIPAPVTAPAATASVTTGFLDADIGTATPAGSSAYNNGTWTVTGAGTDIWGATDSYHYTYKQLTGDFTFIAKVTSVTGTVTKAGIVMRDTLSATAPRRVYFGYVPNATAPLVESHQRGYTANSHNDADETSHDGPTEMLPHWLKIQRIGTRIAVFHSADGGSWTPLQNAEYAGWNDTAYVGLAVCSKTNGTLATATFTDVRITGGDGLEPDKLPSAPSVVYGASDIRRVPLNWMESYAATSYRVKRAATSGGPYTTIATVTGTSYVDTGRADATTYYYVVTGLNAVGESGNSPETAVTTTAVPSTPLNLTATPGSASIGLSWSAPGSVTGYILKRATTSGGPYATLATPSVRSYVDTSVAAGTVYYYIVSAINEVGDGGLSAPVAAATETRTALSIDFRGGSTANGTPTVMGASETAGWVAVSNWNNAAGGSGSLATLTQSDGAATAASVTWAGNGTFSTEIADTAGDSRMMKGYLDTSSTSTSTVTVSNLPAAYLASGYDVYVYSDGANGTADRTGRYTIGATTITATDSGGALFGGAFLRATNSTGNYVVFANQTAASFTLSVTGTSTDSLPRGTLNGIQIVARALTSANSVTVAATTSAAAEFGNVSGVFTVSRTGGTSVAITVKFNLSGTASNATDYALLGSSVVVPAGQSSATINIVPLTDTLFEDSETVTLTLAADPAYAIGSPASATVAIADQPVDQWRLQQFGSQANIPSIAGDLADPDGDGLVNLFEYALGTDPWIESLTPAVSLESGRLALTYSRALAAVDVTYAVEETLVLTGPWTTATTTDEIVSDNGTLRVIKAKSASSSSPTKFLRLRITR